jgi:hypothetical protein
VTSQVVIGATDNEGLIMRDRQRKGGILMEVRNLQAPSSYAASAPSVPQIIKKKTSVALVR